MVGMTLKETVEALVSFSLYDHFKIGNCIQGLSFFFAFHITFFVLHHATCPGVWLERAEYRRGT